MKIQIVEINYLDVVLGLKSSVLLQMQCVQVLKIFVNNFGINV